MARELRGGCTEAEQLLWQRLRRKAVAGFRFRRQHPIGSYIADFYCNEANLVVEIDGAVHSMDEQRRWDELRDRAMRDHGLHVMRISNDAVFSDLDAVVGRIEAVLKTLPR